jgi:pimeloyl-ACP methyl ester carboxylesterase
MRFLIFIVGVAICLPAAEAQELLRVTWPTKHASKPAALQKPASDFLPAFRASLAFLPESNIVTLALSQPAFLGLSEREAVRLQQLCGERYRLIQNDAAFRKVPSALPYCYSEQTPTQGLAIVYRPKNSDPGTPCIVFLHGYGGSFLWYQQLLAEAFPNHVILCPAYGISSAMLPAAYLAECVAAAEQKLGHAIARPTLIGLSAGGFGAVRIYTRSPERFRGLVVLAAYPPEDTMNSFDKRMSAYFLAGSRESYVASGQFARSMRSLRSRGVTIESSTLRDADHFFLLSRREETLKIIRSWLDSPASRGAAQGATMTGYGRYAAAAGQTQITFIP